MEFSPRLFLIAPLLTASILAVPAEHGPFRNEEEVRVRSLPKGHLGRPLAVEEPFVAPDGKHLFFNSNQQEGEKDLHYAKRIKRHWVYQGEMGPNVNTPSQVEGNPTMDANHNFYYIDVKNPFGASKGRFIPATGELVDVRPFEDIVPNKVLHSKNQIRANIGVEVSADGTIMFFSQGTFEFKNGTVGNLVSSNIHFLEKKNSRFAFDRLDSRRIMKNINTKELEYAAGLSKDGLEIFFTRFSVANFASRTLESKIMRASRTALNQPFGMPGVVGAIGERNFVEGPALSPDEKTLYYHKHVTGKSRLYRVTRQ